MSFCLVPFYQNFVFPDIYWSTSVTFPVFPDLQEPWTSYSKINKTVIILWLTYLKWPETILYVILNTKHIKKVVIRH